MKRLLFSLAILSALIAGTLGAYQIIEVPEAVARTTVIGLTGQPPPATQTLTRTLKLTQKLNPSPGTDSIESTAFTPDNNSLLVVAVGVYNDTGASGDLPEAMTISPSTGTATSRLQVAYTSNWCAGIRVWTIPITTGQSMTLTFDAGSYSVGDYFLTVLQYTGYDSSSPIGATATGSDADGDGEATITLSSAPASTSEVVAVATIVMDTGDNTTTEGTGWTEISDQYQGGYHSTQVQVRGNSTSDSVTWADLSTDASGANPDLARMLALEIKVGS